MAKVSIDIPKNKMLLRVDETTYKIVDKPIKLPKSWEEFCNTHLVDSNCWYIDDMSNLTIATKAINYKRNRNPITDRNLFSSKEQAESFLVLVQLIQLRDCYNESEELKDEYAILYDKNSNTFDVWDVSAESINHILIFNSRNIAEQFLDNFHSLIEQAKYLI